MEEIRKQHQQLLTISKEKTEMIKHSETDTLIKLLTNERQIIQKVEQLEVIREQLIDEIFEEKQIKSDEKTVTSLLTWISNENVRRTLEDTATELVELIVLIRESEQLNAELLQQSMQFVQLSLDMIQPQAKNIAYGNHAERKISSQNQSVFDLKV